MAAVVMEHVNKTLKRRQVLKDINLTLEEGLIHGFYGRNASGKTMLFRAVAGLIVPDSGSVTVLGKTITKDKSFPESMGLIIENIGLWNHLTGMENLSLLADIRGIADKEAQRGAMKRVGLDPDDKRRYGAYSMGLKQKLALARAIMERPKILILDEPTNGMDEESVLTFRELMLEEKARGAACLIATHQKEDIRLLCDLVFLMRDGQCAEAEEGALG